MKKMDKPNIYHVMYTANYWTDCSPLGILV